MWINPETLETSEEPLDGYETVLPTQPPLTARLEKAVPGQPEQIEGVWYETWVIEPLTADEILQVEEAERVNAGHTLQQLMGRNNAAYESAFAALTADYPPSEIATWERQRAEALAWDADSSAPTPWIDMAASARGIERTEYLSRTYAKAQAFAQASAYLTGLRQRYDDAIRAAKTPEQLAAIAIDYTLPEASA